MHGSIGVSIYQQTDIKFDSHADKDKVSVPKICPLLALLINNFTFELFAFVITITSLNLFLVLFIAFVFVFVLLANLAVEGSAYQPQPRPPALQWSRRPQRQSQVLPKCETPQILSEQVVVGISLSVCLAHYHKFLLTFEPDLQEIKITSTHFPVFAIHCH